MEVTIRPKNFKLPADLDSQIRKRMERLTRQMDSVDSCEVILSQEPTHFNAQRLQYAVQLTLRTRNNSLIRSEVRNADLLTAVDQAMDRLSRQIERFKGRFYQRKKGKQGIGKSSADVLAQTSVVAGAADMEPVATATPADRDGAALDDELGEIVRTKRFAVQPMYPEEAIEQMELLGHSFFVFYNAGEERVNVLYRRADGNYGLLQPELA
ncbi:MAG: ribosome-associated translation inhibitor RaiA [Chloroflexota bacterium]